MRQHSVVVVGAGMGGLVAALQLAHQGLNVTVVDAADAPGGKLRQLQVGGAAIDSGPTVFTMRWVFDQVLASVGTTLEAELTLHPLEVLARHWWSDGSALDLYADPARTFDAVANFAGLDEAQRFRGFCIEAAEVYRTLEPHYIRGPAPHLWGLTRALGASGLSTLAKLGPMRSLWHTLGRHFRDPRMRQLFARYATYTGSSPWQAPATLMLIAQVELDGVWTIEGGMHALARSLERLAAARGAHFRYGTPCEAIELDNGKAVGIRLAGGEQLRADAVVFNGDTAALRQGLLGAQAASAVSASAPPRSLSALTWSILAPTQGLALDRHNVFFQRDYASEFTDIFQRARLPQTPTVYVCAQDRGTGHTPTGPERLLCLVNAPANGDGHGDHETLSTQDIESCETTSFNLLRQCGLTIAPTAARKILTTPADFHHLFPATGGALYGQASHGWMSAFSRSGANSAVPGLFLAGGSVHPGPGVPMAALSGQLAAEAVLASPGLTRRSHTVGTSGGTSTRSATTVNTA
jgi:1-hydroxycarotenoid 3,4-desaturase